MNVFTDLTRETVRDRRCNIKKTPDQVRACTQREEKKQKFQKKRVAGGLVSKLSGIPSRRQER